MNVTVVDRSWKSIYLLSLVQEYYVHPLNQSLLFLPWTLWHTVNLRFLSMHLHYGMLSQILLEVLFRFRLSKLPYKNFYVGILFSKLWELFHMFYVSSVLAILSWWLIL